MLMAQPGRAAQVCAKIDFSEGEHFEKLGPTTHFKVSGNSCQKTGGLEKGGQAGKGRQLPIFQPEGPHTPSGTIRPILSHFSLHHNMQQR